MVFTGWAWPARDIKLVLRGQRPVALLLSAVSVAGVLALAATSNWVTGARAVAGSTTAGGHTNTYLLGKSVFTTYLWAFVALLL